MNTLHHIFPKIASFSLLLLLNFSLFAQSCGDYTESDYNAIFQSISEAQNSGNESEAKSNINQAKTMVINDLFYLVNETIPSAVGQFCKSGKLSEYMNCLNNLASKGEFLGVESNITDAARNRYKEAVEQWTTELANASVPFSAKPCEDYLRCLFQAQMDRDLAGIAKNETDTKLQQKIDEILLKGCEPCSTKWMIIAEVNISFLTSDEDGTGNRLVNVKGRATWDVVDIILDVNKYQDKCNMMGLSLEKTLPTVRYSNPGLPKPTLSLIDGDKDFATEMIDADIDLDVESTDQLHTIELFAYLGFSDVGEQVNIPIKDKLFNLEKRLPFSVTETVTNDEISSYRADFRFYFSPVFDY
ncbi:MAG: hypothetical protein IT220_05060 [Flavobacteriaceae bacterium]|nr:hypothetical protein [Flavobacteriaceae bacterium]